MRRVAAIAVVVVAILLIGAAAIPYLASGDFLKARIAGQIAAWTGRSVTITGNPSLSFYPYLAVSVDGLVVGKGGADETGEDALITADLLRATLRPLPLLMGRAEFEEFELIRPRIRLVRAQDGTGNWQMNKSAIAEQAANAAAAGDKVAPQRPRNAATSGSESPSLLATDVRIGRLRVTDGIILFDNLATEGREELTDVDIDVLWPSAIAPAGGSGHVTWRGKPVEFNASMQAPLALISGGASPFRLALASTVARVAFAGTADARDGLTFNGNTTITTPSLRDSIGWLGFDLGTSPILGAAAVRGIASASAHAVTFESATVELDGNTARGSVSLALDGARPRLAAELATPHLDLTPYMEAARADLLAHEPWLLAPAHLPFTQALDTDLQLDAEQVILGSLRLAAVTAHAAVAGGALDLRVDKAQLYGGSVSGKVAATSVDGVLAASAGVSVANVPARIALMDVIGAAAIDGRTAASFTIETSGKSWGELIRAATGSGKVTATKGTLFGFDLVTLADLMSDPFAEIGTTDTQTRFHDLAARLTLTDGNIASDDLILQGSDYELRLAGQGSIVTGIVDANALLTTPDTEAPIAISGQWSDPSVIRDLERPRPGVALSPAPTGG